MILPCDLARWWLAASQVFDYYGHVQMEPWQPPTQLGQQHRHTASENDVNVSMAGARAGSLSASPTAAGSSSRRQGSVTAYRLREVDPALYTDRGAGEDQHQL